MIVVLTLHYKSFIANFGNLFQLSKHNFYPSQAKISNTLFVHPFAIGVVRNFAFLQYVFPSSSISSLSFKARGVKFCTQTPHINAKKFTHLIFNFCLGAEMRLKNFQNLFLLPFILFR